MFSRKLETLVECKEFDYQDYVKFRQNYNLSCDVSHPICTFFSLSGDQNKISSQQSVVRPASQYDESQAQCLGNHNVQVFPVSSSPPVQTGEERAPLRATLLPGWWITSQASKHCPPVGQIVDSQMGKHPSS